MSASPDPTLLSKKVSSAVARLRGLGDGLKARLFERDEVVDGLLGALVAGQHVLVLGPPGTAKSLLARLLCDGLEEARFFQWLLTRFTTPEELFGPLDLAALEEGRYERQVDRHLPSAHIAFLDEIFKASSAILNTLLTLLNERRFHNAQQALEVPLIALVGASNEVPEEEGLAALYDRFLVRYWVGPIVDDASFVAMLESDAEERGERPRLSLGELAVLRRAADSVRVGREALDVLVRVRRALSAKGIEVSDRRYRQLLGYLRARALLAGRAVVADADLATMVDCLWSDPEDIPAVREIVDEVLSGYDREAAELVSKARAVVEYAGRSWETAEEEARAVIEAHAKLSRLVGDVERLVARAEARGRVTAGLTDARSALAGMLRQLVADGF